VFRPNVKFVPPINEEHPSHTDNPRNALQFELFTSAQFFSQITHPFLSLYTHTRHLTTDINVSFDYKDAITATHRLQ